MGWEEKQKQSAEVEMKIENVLADVLLFGGSSRCAT